MLKNLLLLSGFSMFVVVVIVIVNLYFSQHKTTISPSVQEHITPITASFDTQAINELKTRTSITADLQEKIGVTKSSDKKSTNTVSTSSESAKSPFTVSPTKAITK